MSIATTEWGTFYLIVLMAIVTLITRWGGVYVMAFIPIRLGVRRFIEAMSGSVLIALLAPMAVTGDLASQAALAITAISMLLIKKPLVAISLGVLSTALIRQLYLI